MTEIILWASDENDDVDSGREEEECDDDAIYICEATNFFLFPWKEIQHHESLLSIPCNGIDDDDDDGGR